ncbi:MAG TPA: hypothetical protein VFP56_11500 [Candidatus Limnocylindrales bacterium]|nr:hypothetical protein [Candidatus Limnocylindrales bacterium]
MPTLACRICGRVVYTAAAFETLFAEESRCPRCGGVLWPERRGEHRRKFERRQNPADAPGAPSGMERRIAERRKGQRRRNDNRAF